MYADRCMTTNSANYCMLVNEWAWSKSQVCLLRLEVDTGAVRDWTEMEIWCIKGMRMLKEVSSSKIGLINPLTQNCHSMDASKRSLSKLGTHTVLFLHQAFNSSLDKLTN